jgi:hypothetical protein
MIRVFELVTYSIQLDFEINSNCLYIIWRDFMLLLKLNCKSL